MGRGQFIRSFAMADKKPFVLRISADTLKELERWATDEFRSTNGQIEYLLQRALNERKKDRVKTKPHDSGAS